MLTRSNARHVVALTGMLLFSEDAHGQAQSANAPTALRVVSGLHSLPLAALRALIADDGLEICSAENVPDERDIPRRQQCHTLRGAELTDDVLRHLQAQWHFGGEPPRLQSPSLRCSHTPEGERCHANRWGPEFYDWFFRGVGPARRLVRVRSSSLDS